MTPRLADLLLLVVPGVGGSAVLVEATTAVFEKLRELGLPVW